MLNFSSQKLLNLAAFQKDWMACAHAKTNLSPPSSAAYWHPTMDNWLELLLGGDQ